jgi:hypothetical protein
MNEPLDNDAGALGKILASIPEIVMLVDRDGVMRYINKVEAGYDRSHAVVVLATNVTELKLAQAEAARLRQLLPICAWCDRIQNSRGSWESIERYLGSEMRTQITHGLCPECCERQLAGVDGDDKTNGDAA